MIAQQEQQQVVVKKTRNKKIKNKIQVRCSFCKKLFHVWKCKLHDAIKRFKGNLYCSKQCSVNAKNDVSFYDKFYWCSTCKWIPKNEAILKPKGTLVINSRKYRLKQDRYYCPKCTSNLTIKKPRKYCKNNKK